MNANSFSGFSNNIPALSNIGTTEMVFTTPIISPATPSLLAAALLSVRPEVALSAGVLEGHPFRVRAAGRVSPAVSTTFQFSCYWLGTTTVSPATVPAAGNKLAQFPAAPTLSASSLFALTLELVWDSTTSKLLGFYEMYAGSTYVSRAPLLNIPSGTNLSTAGQLQFVFSATFGVGNISNSVTLSEISLEQ